MFAVIENGGKQYKLKIGDILNFEKMEKEVGDIVEIKKVMLFIDGSGEPTFGTPFVPLTVKVEVMKNGKSEKVKVVKFKAKKRYARNKGHRQNYTKVRVLSID